MKFKFLAMCLIFLIILNGTFAGKLEVTSINYEPTPAIPGKYVSLWVHVKNNDVASAKKVSVNLVFGKGSSETAYPFYLENSDTTLRPLGDLPMNDTAMAKYNLLVDPKALDGVYEITAELSENGVLKGEDSISVSVLSRKPVIAIISASPTDAAIGKILELELAVKNTGSSTAINLSVGSSEDRTVTSTGVVVERDIIPLGSAFSHVGQLNVNETENAKISFLINPKATAKAYYIPIKLEYFDENKTKYTETSYVGIKVLDEAAIDAAVSDEKPLALPGKKTTITIDLYNAGNGTAKYLTVKIRDESNILILKQSEFLMGSLESDDFDSISFDAIVKDSAKPGTYSLAMDLAYKDSFGETKTVQKNVLLKIYSNDEVQKLNPTESSILPLALAAALIGGGYYFYRKRKQNSKK